MKAEDRVARAFIELAMVATSATLILDAYRATHAAGLATRPGDPGRLIAAEASGADCGKGCFVEQPADRCVTVAETIKMKTSFKAIVLRAFEHRANLPVDRGREPSLTKCKDEDARCSISPKSLLKTLISFRHACWRSISFLYRVHPSA